VFIRTHHRLRRITRQLFAGLVPKNNPMVTIDGKLGDGRIIDNIGNNLSLPLQMLYMFDHTMNGSPVTHLFPSSSFYGP
jgi:hypothetical protein